MSSHRPLEAGSMASAASHADQQAQITLRDELPALEQAGYGRHHPPCRPAWASSETRKPSQRFQVRPKVGLTLSPMGLYMGQMGL